MQKNINKGFTLIEIIVTLVIFTILTTLTFSSYPQLNMAIGLSTSARDLQSEYKSTQISGASRGGGYSGDGIYLNILSPVTYTTFLDDINNEDDLGVFKGDKMYGITGVTVDPPDSIARARQIQNGVYLSDLCVKNTAGPKSCTGELSVTYNRPSTKAVITNYSLDASSKIQFFDRAYIELRRDAAANPLKCIIIYEFGQIELKEGSCNLY